MTNIKQMNNRIGRYKPKYFAKFDMTKGFYQIQLREQDRKITAFIAFCGVYEWLRVPMGQKGAPQYYQRIMALILSGLLYMICENVVDDLITFGKTKEELLINVEKILIRLLENNFTLNPAKCYIGMEEVDFTGHKITTDGIKYTGNKIDQVQNFEKPNNAGQMKSFLGLTNYFRDHIRHYADIVKCLQDMIPKSYTKSKRGIKFIWNANQNESFKKHSK
jgi:hypothetical protein